MMNEFELIDRFRKEFKAKSPKDVSVPNGDDCGVFSNYAITMDSMVESVHFRRDWMSAKDIGFRAVASNMSDIAAMGARPHIFLVDLAVPVDEDPGFVAGVGQGMALLADTHDIYLMGGNVTLSMAGLSITITMIGRTGTKTLRRSGAETGDSILVSGPLGRADIGRMVLENGLDADIFPESVARFRRPQPRIDLAGLLSKRFGVTACIDISDGLLADLGHLCDASQTGALLELDRLPMHREVSRYARETGIDALLPVLTGGEEYELIITAKPAVAQALERNNSMICIGKITKNQGVHATKNGNPVGLPVSRGWQHF